MNEEEFEDRMEDIDADLAARGVSLTKRGFLAYSTLAGQKQFIFQPYNRGLSPFVPPNLLHTVENWYTRRYGKEFLLHGPWAVRPVVIRGHPYVLEIPRVYNATRLPPAATAIRNLTPELCRSLSPEEHRELQDRFWVCYRQVSDVSLLWVRLRAEQTDSLAGQLLERGRVDLFSASETYDAGDPGGILFTCQQATEKFLKAFVSLSDAAVTETQLKDSYGHDLRKLLKAAALMAPRVSSVQVHPRLLSAGPDVRYRTQRLSMAEGVAVLDSAWDICHMVTCISLARLQPEA
jgi:HEPN domain-containing protein